MINEKYRMLCIYFMNQTLSHHHLWYSGENMGMPMADTEARRMELCE